MPHAPRSAALAVRPVVVQAVPEAGVGSALILYEFSTGQCFYLLLHPDAAGNWNRRISKW